HDCATHTLVYEFVNAFNDYFEREISVDEVAIVTSHGRKEQHGRNKFSLQIRSTQYSTTPRECQAFAEYYARQLRRYCLPMSIVDQGIYKETQHIRIPGSTKVGEGRHSRIVAYEPANPSPDDPGAVDIRESWVGHGLRVPLHPRLPPLPLIERSNDTYISKHD